MSIENDTSFVQFLEKKIENDLPPVSNEIESILEIGTLLVTIGGMAAHFVHKRYSKKSDNLYACLHRAHLKSGVLQLMVLMGFYEVSDLGSEKLASFLLYQIVVYLNLLIPIWTSCIALKMFSDLYLFNGAEVYSISEVRRFANGSVVIIQLYEEMMMYLYDMMSFTYELAVIPAIRSTSILLVASVAIMIAMLLFVHSVTHSDRRTTLIYLIDLSLLLSCDCVLFVYRVRCLKSDGFTVVAILLSARLLFEMAWSVVLIFLDVPLCGGEAV